MCSSGDGDASPGDTGDITGALTGRLDLLSGVDAIAEVDREQTMMSIRCLTALGLNETYYAPYSQISCR